MRAFSRAAHWPSKAARRGTCLAASHSARGCTAGLSTCNIVMILFAVGQWDRCTYQHCLGGMRSNVFAYTACTLKARFAQSLMGLLGSKIDAKSY